MPNKLQPRIIAIIITITLSMAALSGCSQSWHIGESNQSSANAESSDNQITTLGLEQDFSYDIPVSTAHIEVDQLGYLPQSKKIAVFRGTGLSDTFDVISADTMESVFTGEIKQKLVKGTTESYYFGDFSEVKTKGTYYVLTDVIGYSYPFVIDDNLYDHILTDGLKQFYLNRCGVSLTKEYAEENERSACHIDTVTLKSDAGTTLDVSGGWHIDTAGDRSVIRGCDAIEALLFAYEYNKEAFGDNCSIPESGDGIPDILNEIYIETDWLLKMQDATTGAVYSAVSVVDQGKGAANPYHLEDVDMDATLSFASALGYFSYVYQEFDIAYATTCLQAADRAMKYVANVLRKEPNSVNMDEYFRAAAQLYRATGYNNYHKIILNYCSDITEYQISDNVVFSGVVCYLATKQKTESSICGLMMKDLKHYAEDLSTDRKDALYLMGAETIAVEHQVLLTEIARLTVINYIISSNEYENIMEKYLHYFLGCNPDNMCYIGRYGSNNIADMDHSLDIFRNPETDAYLILLASGMKLR